LLHAGRLQHYLDNWKLITSDNIILKAINGYRIEFLYEPIQTNDALIYPLAIKEKIKIDDELNYMSELGVIEAASHEQGEFISSIFSRPKKDGSVRVILNLTKLNDFIEYHKFKMDTFNTVVKMMKQDCYMATIDLKLAYYLIPIHCNDKKYLRFMWNNCLMQYTVLPNGLSSAPRLFTKLMKPVLATLREQGHLVSCYIDDIYIQGDSYEDCLYSLRATSDLLTNLGFVINKEKSMVTPKRLVKVLGFHLDSINMKITLTEDKISAITLLCKQLKESNVITIRFLAKVIGNLVACFPAVTYGQLYYRQLEHIKVKELSFNKGNYDAKLRVPTSVKSIMTWWINNLDRSSVYINKGNPELIIETDASLTGWGAACLNKHTGGAFVAEDIGDTLNINLLELKAIKFGILAFQDTIRKHRHILVKSDNTTAVAYVKNMGGKKRECNEIAKDIWLWCMKYNIWLTITYIPGVDNVTADYESRKINDRTEWMLDPRVFTKINHRWGPLTIDLFASRTNSQLYRYVSWKPDPYALYIDAFTGIWNNELFYAFPPFSMIGSCLQKIEQERATGVFVCPLWTTQPWFPVAMMMLVDDPHLLPKSTTLLQLAHKPGEVHPLFPKMRTLVCKLSGDHTRSNNYRQKLWTSSWHHGDREHGSSMLQQSTDGLNFAIKGKLVYIRQM